MPKLAYYNSRDPVFKTNYEAYKETRKYDPFTGKKKTLIEIIP